MNKLFDKEVPPDNTQEAVGLQKMSNLAQSQTRVKDLNQKETATKAGKSFLSDVGSY